jgi:type IV pilus assembly protein PilV
MNRQRGDSIIEGLIALAILSVGILGMIALQGTLVGVSADAQLRLEAAFYAEQLVGHAQADPANANCYALTTPCTNTDARTAATTWLTDVQNRLPGSTTAAPVVTFTPSSGQFSVVVQWQHPGDDTVRNVSTATVLR